MWYLCSFFLEFSSYSGSFVVPHKPNDFWLHFYKDCIDIFMGIALHLYIALHNITILTMLILPFHEHKIPFISLCLFQSFLVMLYSFQYIGLSQLLLCLFLGILFFCLQLQKEFLNFFFWSFIVSVYKSGGYLYFDFVSCNFTVFVCVSNSFFW